MTKINDAMRARFREEIGQAMIRAFPQARGELRIDIDVAAGTLIECLGAVLSAKETTRTPAGRKAEFAAVLDGLAKVIALKHAEAPNVLTFPQVNKPREAPSIHVGTARVSIVPIEDGLAGHKWLVIARSSGGGQDPRVAPVPVESPVIALVTAAAMAAKHGLEFDGVKPWA